MPWTHSDLSISGRQLPDQANTRFFERSFDFAQDDNSPQSSTILPELPDFISSIASLNCV